MNGFKLNYTGSASSVAVTYAVIGGYAQMNVIEKNVGPKIDYEVRGRRSPLTMI